MSSSSKYLATEKKEMHFINVSEEPMFRGSWLCRAR